MRFNNYSTSLALFILLFAACEPLANTCDGPSMLDTATTCQSLMCTGSLADCQNGAADGCETDTATDLNHCGGCGITCPTPANGEAKCVDGVCGVSSCGTRYKDCNTSAVDGCEVDTFRDANNCGACGKVCQGGTNAVGVCILGECKLACQAAYLDCNNDAADGCETNGAMDLANCGNCGNTCTAAGATTPACAAGSCVTTACTGTNFTCKAGPVESCETDRATNVNNCGTCGKVCGAVANGKPGCAASNCGIGSCNTGYDNCDSDIATGCETNLTTNVNNCNACGTKCPLPANAAASCVASTCGMGACNAGFGDCDNNPATGCEINTTNDKNNCGMCGKVCTGANEQCVSGACVTNCRSVGGIRWCYNPSACGEPCNAVCASIGSTPVSDAAAFASQDTLAECQALSVAFGLGTSVQFSSFAYACLEDSYGAHSGTNGGLVGPIFCSSDASCPAAHRTNMDQIGLACGAGSRRSICPCQ